MTLRTHASLRVAFVVHVMQVAGAEVLVVEIIRRLRGRIDPHVFCLDAAGPLGEVLQEEGVPVMTFNRRPGVDWGLFRRLSREIRSRRIDVVHAHQYTPFFYSSVAARLSGRRPRVIFTEHGRHYPDVVSTKRRMANRWLFDGLADDITAVCEFSARALSTNDGFSRGRIQIVPNGIDLDRYVVREDKARLRERLGLDAERLYVTIVARFHPVKDHATLLTAFAAIARQRADVDLLLVGDGPLRGALERQALSLGITSRVRMVGVQSNVSEWLQASDVFTLSSVSEAASITLLEAMASGLPAVVTDVGGNPELVRRDQDGLLVPRGDVPALASALRRLLSEPATRRSMGASGMRRVRDEFQMNDTVARYASLFERR